MSRDRDLQWKQIDDVLGVPGWSLHVGYSYTQEIGDAPDVWIHCAILETGKQSLQLNRLDLPNFHQLEAIVAEAVEDENRQAALELAQPDPRDDGDYSFDIANERRYVDHLTPMLHALKAVS
jgi:hypothetical protein